MLRLAVEKNFLGKRQVETLTGMTCQERRDTQSALSGAGLGACLWGPATRLPLPGLGEVLWDSVSPRKDPILTAPSSDGPPQLLTYGSPSRVSKHGESSMTPSRSGEAHCLPGLQ